jgi:hypothetical protein
MFLVPPECVELQLVEINFWMFSVRLAGVVFRIFPLPFGSQALNYRFV